jgi:hypothetical protein
LGFLAHFVTYGDFIPFLLFNPDDVNLKPELSLGNEATIRNAGCSNSGVHVP